MRTTTSPGYWGSYANPKGFFVFSRFNKKPENFDVQVALPISCFSHTVAWVVNLLPRVSLLPSYWGTRLLRVSVLRKLGREQKVGEEG